MWQARGIVDKRVLHLFWSRRPAIVVDDCIYVARRTQPQLDQPTRARVYDLKSARRVRMHFSTTSDKRQQLNVDITVHDGSPTVLP